MKAFLFLLAAISLVSFKKNSFLQNVSEELQLKNTHNISYSDDSYKITIMDVIHENCVLKKVDEFGTAWDENCSNKFRFLYKNGELFIYSGRNLIFKKKADGNVVETRNYSGQNNWRSYEAIFKYNNSIMLRIYWNVGWGIEKNSTSFYYKDSNSTYVLSDIYGDIGAKNDKSNRLHMFMADKTFEGFKLH